MASKIDKNGKKSRRDIPTFEEASWYNRIKSKLGDTDKGSMKFYEQFYKDELDKEYLTTRQKTVDRSRYSGANVVLAKDVRELYAFVIERGKNVSEFSKFKREFNNSKKYVKGFAVKREKSKTKT